MGAAAWITLAGVTVGVVSHLGVAIYIYGRMSARVDGHSSWIKRIDEDLSQMRADTSEQFSDHGQRIARLEGGLMPHRHGHS